MQSVMKSEDFLVRYRLLKVKKGSLGSACKQVTISGLSDAGGRSQKPQLDNRTGFGLPLLRVGRILLTMLIYIW